MTESQDVISIEIAIINPLKPELRRKKNVFSIIIENQKIIKTKGT